MGRDQQRRAVFVGMIWPFVSGPSFWLVDLIATGKNGNCALRIGHPIVIIMIVSSLWELL